MNRIPRPLAASIRAIFAATMLASATVAAEPRPLRVLFYDPLTSEQSNAGVLRLAMEQLGRDAIYFDYFTPSSGPQQEAGVEVVLAPGSRAGV